VFNIALAGRADQLSASLKARRIESALLTLNSEQLVKMLEQSLSCCSDVLDDAESLVFSRSDTSADKLVCVPRAVVASICLFGRYKLGPNDVTRSVSVMLKDGSFTNKVY